MIHTDGERAYMGHIQHLALPKDSSPVDHRNGEDSHVLAQCIPSSRRSITGPKSTHHTDGSTSGLQTPLSFPIQ